MSRDPETPGPEQPEGQEEDPNAEPVVYVEAPLPKVPIAHKNGLLLLNLN